MKPEALNLGGEEGAGVVVFRAVLVERVKEQIGVERNHRASAGSFVGQRRASVQPAKPDGEDSDAVREASVG